MLGNYTPFVFDAIGRGKFWYDAPPPRDIRAVHAVGTSIVAYLLLQHLGSGHARRGPTVATLQALTLVHIVECTYDITHSSPPRPIWPGAPLSPRVQRMALLAVHVAILLYRLQVPMIPCSPQKRRQ